MNIPENHYLDLREMGLLEVLDSKLAVLGDAQSYRDKTGLTLTPESGKAIFVEI
ncbi:hypothetical protein [Faecalispora anaeroviscerum]|uniref:hypothetical protein n=1 Tax=Faecalispora anaeroviscerum TaxID=2991836 RepID=UPI0024B9C4EE|nr:hypothetical protein [Faecalispora anaeroviscerum]